MIHIVFGETGEYSDYNTWPVKAFESLDDANDYKILAQNKAESLFLTRKAYDIPNNPLDPNMRMDYTGTEYYVSSIEFVPQNYKYENNNQ